MTEITGQLPLFTEAANGIRNLPPAAKNGNGHAMTKAEAGLGKSMPPGAERLLAAMVKRGLKSSDLRVAAMLALALEEAATK